jgi:hypothetical protein
VDEIAIELRSSAAAERLREGLVSHGHTATANGHEVQVKLAPQTHALNRLLSDFHEWLAGEPEAYGLVRLHGHSYIFERPQRRVSPDQIPTPGDSHQRDAGDGSRFSDASLTEEIATSEV